jgi:uncharacterized protein YprB with RNaseH-like and TPR domain
MLTNTFCHIPGIGEKTERSLWSAGVISWDSAVPQVSIRLPRPLQESWDRHIEESHRNYKKRNAGYFAEKLPSNQQWRLYRDFRDDCAFVDIETTGLFWEHEITTAVLYDARSIRYYVNGDNLEQLPRDLKDYRLLVTYNGKRFDIPLIERFFHIRLPQAHIDLRYPLWTIGLKGGLKGCERHLGIGRPGLEGVDGFVAVLLWNEYRKRKDVKALETLLAYNVQDTVALHALMVHALNENVKATPFSASHSLPPPLPPEPPFQADHDTVKRLLDHAFGSTTVPYRSRTYSSPTGVFGKSS